LHQIDDKPGMERARAFSPSATSRQAPATFPSPELSRRNGARMAATGAGGLAVLFLAGMVLAGMVLAGMLTASVAAAAPVQPRGQALAANGAEPLAPVPVRPAFAQGAAGEDNPDCYKRRKRLFVDGYGWVVRRVTVCE